MMKCCIICGLFRVNTNSIVLVRKTMDKEIVFITNKQFDLKHGLKP